MISGAAARPFVKWAGGKRSLLPELLARIPRDIRTYHEPFVGGGAMFFALESAGWLCVTERVCLNDANVHLMRTFAAVRDDVAGVVRRLRRARNDPDAFARARRKDPTKMCGGAELAAWFIYLNRTCFNGLWRVNKAGTFNAPFGRYANPTICDADNLRACAAALARVRMTSKDFVDASPLADARPGDFYYLDPPYLPRTGKEFTAYTSGGFGRGDHERLARHAVELKRRGAAVMITNSGTDEVREMFAPHGFRIDEVRVGRPVAADGTQRGKIPDFIIT